MCNLKDGQTRTTQNTEQIVLCSMLCAYRKEGPEHQICIYDRVQFKTALTIHLVANRVRDESTVSQIIVDKLIF